MIKLCIIMTTICVLILLQCDEVSNLSIYPNTPEISHLVTNYGVHSSGVGSRFRSHW